LEIKLFLIDNWDPADEIIFTVDSVPYSIKGIDSSNFDGNICSSGSKKDQSFLIYFFIPHSGTTLQVQATS